MLAARESHQSVVEVLVKAGASPDIQTKVGVYLIESCESCSMALYVSPALSI